MENWKVRFLFLVPIWELGAALMFPEVERWIVLVFLITITLIVLLWPFTEEEEYEEIYWPDPELERFRETAKRIQEHFDDPLREFKKAAVKSGAKIRIVGKKKHVMVWDKYLEDKTEWP